MSAEGQEDAQDYMSGRCFGHEDSKILQRMLCRKRCELGCFFLEVDLVGLCSRLIAGVQKLAQRDALVGPVLDMFTPAKAMRRGVVLTHVDALGYAAHQEGFPLLR